MTRPGDSGAIPQEPGLLLWRGPLRGDGRNPTFGHQGAPYYLHRSKAPKAYDGNAKAKGVRRAQVY
jgi:hypothetical protein